MGKFTSTLLWPIAAGVLVAVVMLGLFPDASDKHPRTVEVFRAQPQESPTTPLGAVSYAAAVEAAAPAVVNIYTLRAVPPQDGPQLQSPYDRAPYPDGQEAQPRQHTQTSLGSGVIVSPQGYLLTNNHVIAGAARILVALRDGREAPAEIVGTDPETDLAVLHINLPDLPVITLGSSEKLRVGDVVLAIGNPFGVGQTVTQGIVSATGRNRLGINTYENFIQTDAAINPGNSGGALVDAWGNMVGINTAIFSRSGGSQGIGFAIPSDLARSVLEQILAHGRVVRGWLGIEAQEMTPVLAESFGMDKPRGLVIAGIFRNSPAQEAGLRPGDVLLSIDGKEITSSRSAMSQIAATRPGQVISMQVLRDGRIATFNVTIGDRPPQRPAGS